ncbi:T-cell surface glycoprotein CD8 beta chain [Lampris incognitus]|uniref:T-cell surface glycoprotein CD8 beta chain n=1 Tax=Lampris incognitus TaxID=2546036 RepID=UPI0024B5ADF2|nr:T-cell surface glycoprotein CD8 beta chain [Lampris incognitus]
MTLPALLWTVTTAFLWRSGSGQIPSQARIPIRYPKISGSETIPCDCRSPPCERVYWYRSLTSNNKLQFLAHYTNVGRHNYGEDVKPDQFKLRKRDSTFELIINNVSADDAGLYSCVLNNKEEGWKPGVLLQPGATPPPLSTKRPKTTPKKKPRLPVVPVCHIRGGNNPEGGCMVLWLLVGACAFLTVALLSTLYYFSRLPKKCRHHFVKKSRTMQ